MTPIEIVFAEGLYYCPLATIIEVNTQYDHDDIVEGFQIVNQATDLASSSLLIGVFNLWKITYVSYRDPNGSTLSFYVLFDEYSSYLATGARPSAMEVFSTATATRTTTPKLGQCALFN